MSNLYQQCLFINKEDIDLYKSVKSKRVHYKNTTYTKCYKNDVSNGVIISDDILNWGKISHLYRKLASFFPIPLFTKFQPVTDYGLVRVWRTDYEKEPYNHYGNTYMGQEFRVTEAELIGSEDLDLSSRIFLHESFIDLLEQGIKPDEELFKQEIEFLKTHSLYDLLLYLSYLQG